MLTFDACADNRALLAKFGVRLAYPHFSLAPLASEQGNIPMASFKEYLLSQSAEGKSCDTLLLIMPGAFLLQDKLSLLCRALVECFPKADIEAFVSLARQDVVLESAAVFGVLQGPMPLNGKFREWVIAEQQGYFHYLAPLAALFETLGKKHVRCHVEATDPMAHLVAQASLWVHMGVNLPEDKATELAVIPPILALDLPQEFCLFCNASNMLRTTWYPPFSSPWNSQTRYFSGVDTRVNGLFNPAERAGLVESCERENMVVAKLLGGKALFEPVPPEKNYSRINRLTAESAFAVAECLDRAFARTCLEEYEAFPRQYMTRDQRICHAALLALDSSARVEENREKALKPKVSVLTLTYNHADFIEQNIQSVLEQQTDFPIEHIIADDDSDDGTQEIILRYAKRYPHIVPVFQRTRSYGSANTRALFESASSEYVALCDGDDYFTDPCKLQTQADFLDAHQNCALCFHPVEVVYEDGSERSRVYPPLDILPGGVKPFYRLADLLSFNFIQTNSVMYRWRFKDGLPDWFRTDILPGDLYWHILHAELGNIGFIDKKMSVYRRHRDAVYYMAEINTKVHSGLHGLEKLKAYAAINEHFKGEHFSILKDLMFGVFADSLSQAIETGNNENFFLMLERYPTFAKHFLVRVNDPQTGRS